MLVVPGISVCPFRLFSVIACCVVCLCCICCILHVYILQMCVCVYVHVYVCICVPVVCSPSRPSPSSSLSSLPSYLGNRWELWLLTNRCDALLLLLIGVTRAQTGGLRWKHLVVLLIFLFSLVGFYLPQLNSHLKKMLDWLGRKRTRIGWVRVRGFVGCNWTAEIRILGRHVLTLWTILGLGGMTIDRLAWLSCMIRATSSLLMKVV